MEAVSEHFTGTSKTLVRRIAVIIFFRMGASCSKNNYFLSNICIFNAAVVVVVKSPLESKDDPQTRLHTRGEAC